jgi:hypothetical protein
MLMAGAVGTGLTGADRDLLVFVKSATALFLIFFLVYGQRKNREKRQIRQQNKKKKVKKNKDSKKNVSSNVRIDGFENTDADL